MFASTKELFVYGTLMAPECLEAVAGRAFSAEPATLEGYRRHALRKRVYPGMVPSAGGRVEGLLIHSVDPVSLSLLDDFEGDDYQRQTVMVTTQDGSPRPAETYVWKDARRAEVLDEPWDYEVFRAKHLKAWLNKIG